MDLSSARHQATLVSRETRASDRKCFFWLRFQIHTTLSSSRGDAGEDYQPRTYYRQVAYEVSNGVLKSNFPRAAEINPWQAAYPFKHSRSSKFRDRSAHCQFRVRVRRNFGYKIRSTDRERREWSIQSERSLRL